MDEKILECPECGTKGCVNDPSLPRPLQETAFHKYGLNVNQKQKYKCRKCGRIFTGTKKGRPKKSE